MAIAESRGPGPSAGEIRVRRMDLEFPEGMSEYFFDDNPFLSAMLASLSVGFPPGERYFIHSVRHFLPLLDDPALRKRVRAFTGQEANHTKEHIAFNAFLDRRGYPAKAMEELATKAIAAIENASSPEANLARTAALEHFTAIFAGSFLENPEVLDRLDGDAATLWAWHAIEEVEHRSVAFDVYRQTVDDESLRRRVMVLTTVVFVSLITLRTFWMMAAKGRRFELRATFRGLNLLWGRPGIFRRLVPQYLAYYRRDFHPSQHDNVADVDRARLRYLGEEPAATAA